MSTTLSTERVNRSIVTLSNVNELAVRVLRNVVGNDIADTLNGSPLTNALICSIVQSRTKTVLERRLACR